MSELNIANQADLKVNRLKYYLNAIVRRPEFVIAAATIIIAFLITLVDPTFIGVLNIKSMLNSLSFSAMVSVPLAFVLIAKYRDMSVGAVTGLLGAVMVVLMKNFQIAPMLSLLIIIALGGLLGLLNGLAIVNLKINAYIFTLAMMYTYRGLHQVIADARSITGLPESITSLADIKPLGLPLNVYALILIAIIGSIILKNTTFGRSIYIIGNNQTYAKTSGINITRNVKLLYVLTGCICAISAFFLAITYRAANITAGTGWEFEVTAGCILGGCSLYGGKGTVWGAILGILFMTVIRYALQALRMNASGYQVLITGAVLIISVIIDVARERKLKA